MDSSASPHFRSLGCVNFFPDRALKLDIALMCSLDGEKVLLGRFAFQTVEFDGLRSETIEFLTVCTFNGRNSRTALQIVEFSGLHFEALNVTVGTAIQ